MLKDWRPRDLLDAVRAAAQGPAPLEPRVAKALLPSAEPRPVANSRPQLHVLKARAEGIGHIRSPATLASSESL